MPGLLTGNIRLGAEIKLRRYGLWDYFETGGFADDSEDRNHIAAAVLERGRRLLGGNLCGGEILVVGTHRMTSGVDNSSARRCWPWPPAARRWRN